MGRNWRDAFDRIILERGREYFEDDRVDSLDFKTPLEFETTVLGSRPYHIKARLDEHGDLARGCCDCPYFEDDNCKHLAAALFAWEMSKSDGCKSNQCNDAKDDAISDFTRRFARIRRLYMGRNGYIGYWEAYHFTQEAQVFLDSGVHSVINSEPSQSFELILKILRMFLDTPMDDDGGIYDFCQHCLEILDEIYQMADAKLMHDMYDNITKDLCSSSLNIEYIETYLETLETFWSSHFNLPEFYDAKCKILDQKIQDCLSGNHEDFNIGYELEKWLLSKAKLIEACAKSPSEVEGFYLQYYAYNRIRYRYIDWLISSKEYKRTYQALAKLINECDTNYERKIYYRQQVAVSEALKDIDTQKRCLLRLLEIDDGNLEDYNKLKSLYSPTEWHKIRKKIILKVPCNYTRLLLFDLENMLPELKSEVAISHDLRLLDDYRKKLASEYPEETLGYYYQFLQEEANRASNRKHYHWLASVLRHLSNLPGGRNVATDIVAEWQEKYSRRSAMMEELERFR